MKVYELLSLLERLPANMDVVAQGEGNNGEPFRINRIDVDEPPEPGMTCLILFDDALISYEGDE